MAVGGAKLSVVAAIGGNSIVMIAKFVGFAMTGSGAMLSEGIHTFADVLNQILLFVGIQKSTAPPDRYHPYGYGAERYVWSLMSAVGIFFLGCGVTIYHGVESLLHPQPVTNLPVAIAVLAFALLIEGAVLGVALKQLHYAAEGKPFVKYLRTEADPTAVAVVLEDSAACLGVVIAFGAIVLTRLTGSPVWDAIGSITIGLLLGAVAVWLIMRNRSSLVGEAIPVEHREKIRQILSSHPVVEKLIVLKSRVIDPHTYRIQAELEFDGAVLAKKLEPRLRAAYEQIESYEDFEKFASTYADQVTQVLGDEVDEIERQIRVAVPKATYVDLESD